MAVLPIAKISAELHKTRSRESDGANTKDELDSPSLTTAENVVTFLNLKE
jgi:hypothetical protein